MFRKAIFYLVFVALFWQPSYASCTLWRTIKTDAVATLYLGAKMSLAWIPDNEQEIDRAAWLLPTLAISGLLDRPLQRAVLHNQDTKLKPLLSFDRFFGNRRYYVPLLAGAYLGSLFITSPEFHHYTLKSAQAVFFTAVIASIMKEITGRARPYQNKGPLFFKPLAFNEGMRSLPSGHTTVSFALATILSKAHASFLWKGFWYGTALLTGVARIYHNKHWFSDTVFGAVLGYGIARFVWKEKSGEEGMQLQYYSGGGIGLRWTVYLN